MSFFFVGILCGAMCMCYLSPITFFYIYRLSLFQELGSSRFEVWIFIASHHLCLLVSLLNAFAFRMTTYYHCHVPFLFLLLTVVMASFSVGIPGASAKPLKLMLFMLLLDPLQVMVAIAATMSMAWLGTWTS